eukprot:scaffold4566_cov118-Isochrysis_galbana.AAC.1
MLNWVADSTAPMVIPRRGTQSSREKGLSSTTPSELSTPSIWGRVRGRARGWTARKEGGRAGPGAGRS